MPCAQTKATSSCCRTGRRTRSETARAPAGQGATSTGSSRARPRAQVKVLLRHDLRIGTSTRTTTRGPYYHPPYHPRDSRRNGQKRRKAAKKRPLVEREKGFEPSTSTLARWHRWAGSAAKTGKDGLRERTPHRSPHHLRPTGIAAGKCGQDGGDKCLQRSLAASRPSLGATP
jgi:hypothetical protein